MEELRELREILDRYPNFMNNHFPHSVECSPQDGHLDLPFKRIMPNMCEIESVKSYKKAFGCVLVVKYVLNDGSDLPMGPGLEILVNSLTKYTPLNTIIIDKRLCLPKIVEISYVVCCNCSSLDFELHAYPPQVQEMKEDFKLLKI